MSVVVFSVVVVGMPDGDAAEPEVLRTLVVIREAASGLVGRPTWSLSDAEMRSSVAEADAAVAAMQAARLSLIRDLDERPDAVPGAPEHLTRAAAAGMHLAYVTNNASRPPSSVAEHLRELGIHADAHDVVSSAQAAASLLADRLPAGSPVFVIGGNGLFEALDERGLRPVQAMEDAPVAVVSGYHPDVLWRTVMAGALLVQRGLLWVASNTDMTVTSPSID